MTIRIGTANLRPVNNTRKDAMITGGEPVADKLAPATGTRYVVRKFTFGDDVWHVFVGGLWRSAHTGDSGERCALDVLRRVGIDI